MCVTTLLLATACDSPEERLVDHVKNGQELLEQRSFDKASLEFRNALQINSDHIPALYGLSQIEERRANWRAVRNLLEKIIDLDPNHLEATVRLGRMMLLGGQIDRALELSNKASEIDPESIDALTFKAALLLNLDDPQGALAAANKALQKDPGNVDALSVLAAERMAAGEMREAIALLDTGIKQDERNVALQLIKIRALASLDAIDEVETVLKRLIDLYPDTDAFKTSLVNLYMRQERLDDAEAILREKADANPGDIEPALNVVRFLNTVRGPDSAIVELRRLIDQGDANVSQYRMALAQLYFTQQDSDKATQVLDELLASEASAEDKLTAKNQMAEMARLAGDFDRAKAILAEILGEDSKNAAALMTRGAIRNVEQQYDDAIIDLRTVLRDEPDSLRALVLLGTAYEGNGAPELADDQYTRAFQVAEGAASIGLPFANFLARRGDLNRADEVLSRVVQVEPNNVTAHRALAQIRINLRDWAGAEQVAERLRELQDEDSVINRIKGIALQGQQKFDQSVRAFEQSQQAAPDAFRPMASLVDAYYRSGEPEKAEAFLKSVLETSSDNVFAHVLLGQLYSELDRKEDAEQVLLEAVESNPKSAVAYTALSRFKSLQGDRDGALAVLDQGLAEIPGDATLGLLKAGIFERENKPELAMRQYKEMYEANVDSPLVANNYASTLLSLQGRSAAKEVLEVMQPFMNASVPQFKDTIGWAYFLDGQNEKALAYLRDSAEQLPNLAEVRFHLGQAYRAAGNVSAAIAEFEKVVEISEQTPFPQIDEVKLALEELKKKVGTFSGD
ncbi:tetratricopeptide repeat protein [Hwanghaeella grinnelliae]|uniref:tetratricopeptide repeat protein n=1 Tax=Hwanghaeella grinnelliae TaxID=2500179 RepID=UPI0013872807|nr:tetratricopeptide repeat protein [Hwanghaeella grinnelliae]